jgi:hypothetical protein
VSEIWRKGNGDGDGDIDGLRFSFCFCSGFDAGLFKNTVIRHPCPASWALVKKLTTRPSTSAYEHSAAAGGPGGCAIAHQGEVGEVSDWRWNNRTPHPPGTRGCLSTTCSSFSSFRTASPLQVAAVLTPYCPGIDLTLEVKVYSTVKDGLNFPPLAEVQTLEGAMLSPGHGAIEADADREVRHRWIIHSMLERRTEQVYRLPRR